MSSSKENMMSKLMKGSQPQKKNSITPPVDIPKNSNAHVSQINTEIESVQLAERTLNSHLKDCKTIIDQIKEKSDVCSEELNATLSESLNRVNEVFNSYAKAQIMENEKYQQKLEKLKAEKNELQKIVVECAKKCSQFEEELGRY